MRERTKVHVYVALCNITFAESLLYPLVHVPWNSDEITSPRVTRRCSEMFRAGILRLSRRNKKERNDDSEKASK